MSKTWVALLNVIADKNTQELRSILAKRDELQKERIRRSIVKRCPPGSIVCKRRIVDSEYL